MTTAESFATAGPADAPPPLDTPEERDALACPLCRYSFRGLSTIEHPQCPECGYRFEWAELLRARQHAHPYLFEHHPQRSFWSFVRTLLHGLFPRSFWSSLNAGHAIRRRRLAAYWCVVAGLVFVTGFVGGFVVHAVTVYQQTVAFALMRSGRLARAPAPWSPPLLRAAARNTFDDSALEPYLLAGAVAWPWLTLGALLIYQASMRRAKVRPAHVLRCVVYAGDVFIWSGAALLLLSVLRYARLISANRMWDSTLAVRQTAFCFLLLLAVATYRLGVAYRQYLRFDRPWATVLASQAVVLLAIITTLSLVYAHFWKLIPTS